MGLPIDRVSIAGLALACMVFPTGADASAAPESGGSVVKIGYLAQRVKRHPPASWMEPPHADEGLDGARAGLADDNTTGRFTGQSFVLKEAIVPEGGDAAAALRGLIGEGIRFVVADLPAPTLADIAALPETAPVTLLNVAAPDDELRAESCRANLLHLAPSRAMLADALMQYLAAKRWRRILLAVGRSAGDRSYAVALRRAAQKFQVRVVEEKPWTFEPGARRTDTGHYAIEAEVARFTQGISYDVLAVADEDDEFGDALSYRTAAPRPVAGTQGLVPSAWARPFEQWGATQLQNRFRRLANRWMTDRDYAGWIAVRAIGESATRTRSADPGAIASFMRSDKFELAAFKGVPVSFRPWDGQLRQPILLADARALVSVSPQPGFLHQFSQLDTLGIDQLESKCRL